MTYSPYFGKTLLTFEPLYVQDCQSRWSDLIGGVCLMELKTESIEETPKKKNKIPRTKTKACIALTFGFGYGQKPKKMLFKFENDGNYPESEFTYLETTGKTFKGVDLGFSGSLSTGSPLSNDYLRNGRLPDSKFKRFALFLKDQRFAATPKGSLLDICEHIMKTIEKEIAKLKPKMQQELKGTFEAISLEEHTIMAQDAAAKLTDDHVPKLTFEVSNFNAYAKNIDCGFTLHPSEMTYKQHNAEYAAEIRFSNSQRKSIKTFVSSWRIEQDTSIEILKKKLCIGGGKEEDLMMLDALDKNIFFSYHFAGFGANWEDGKVTYYFVIAQQIENGYITLNKVLKSSSNSLLHCMACVTSTILCGLRELEDNDMKHGSLDDKTVWIGKENFVKLSHHNIRQVVLDNWKQSPFLGADFMYFHRKLVSFTKLVGKTKIDDLRDYRNLVELIKQKLQLTLVGMPIHENEDERNEFMSVFDKFNNFYELLKVENVNLDNLRNHSYLRETVLSAPPMKQFNKNQNPIAEDRHIRSEYMWRNFLGCGRFAYTFVARKHTTDRDVAIKRIEITEGKSARAFLKEIKVLNKLKHDHIVRYDHSWTGDFNDGLPRKNDDCSEVHYLSMDFCQKGNLREVIERGDLKEAPVQIIKIIINVLDAVKHIHEKSYPHSDLHDENLLFTSNLEPIIADFGHAFPGSYTAGCSRGTAAMHKLSVIEGDYCSVGEYFYEMLLNLSMISGAEELNDLEEEGVWAEEFCDYFPDGFIGEFVKFYLKRQIRTLMSESEDGEKPQSVLLHLNDLVLYLSTNFPKFPVL